MEILDFRLIYVPQQLSTNEDKIILIYFFLPCAKIKSIKQCLGKMSASRHKKEPH